MPLPPADVSLFPFFWIKLVPMFDTPADSLFVAPNVHGSSKFETRDIPRNAKPKTSLVFHDKRRVSRFF